MVSTCLKDFTDLQDRVRRESDPVLEHLRQLSVLQFQVHDAFLEFSAFFSQPFLCEQSLHHLQKTKLH